MAEFEEYKATCCVMARDKLLFQQGNNDSNDNKKEGDS